MNCNVDKCQLLRRGMLAIACGASEGIRKHEIVGGTKVPQKGDYWFYLFLLMKHCFYLKTISDLSEEMKIVYI